MERAAIPISPFPQQDDDHRRIRDCLGRGCRARPPSDLRSLGTTSTRASNFADAQTLRPARVLAAGLACSPSARPTPGSNGQPRSHLPDKQNQSHDSHNPADYARDSPAPGRARHPLGSRLERKDRFTRLPCRSSLKTHPTRRRHRNNSHHSKTALTRTTKIARQRIRRVGTSPQTFSRVVPGHGVLKLSQTLICSPPLRTLKFLRSAPDTSHPILRGMPSASPGPAIDSTLSHLSRKFRNASPRSKSPRTSHCCW